MMMLKKLIYLIVLILFLEVAKTVLDKLNYPWSYLASAILASIQFLFTVAFIFYVFCWWIFPRFFRQGKRNWLFVASFVLVIGICESLFAWWLHHPERMPRFLHEACEYYYYHYDLDIVQYDASLSTYNPKLFYTLKPGVTGKFQNKEFNTTISANSCGLRDDEASLKQPSIICLGDSYAMGWGVESEETFSQSLEHMSGRKVLNAGISSYGTAREMILLNELDTTGLSVVVIQYSSNDYNENAAYLANNNRLVISSRGAYDSLVSRQRFIGYYFPGKYFTLISQVFFKQQINKMVPVFRMGPSEGQNLNEKEHAAVFANLLGRSPIDFKKIRVIVIAVGDSPGFGQDFILHLKGILGQPSFHNNVLAVETHDVLKDEDWFIMDRHLKPSGHQKLAKKIYAIIREP
jgi:hypothetical protein